MSFLMKNLIKPKSLRQLSTATGNRFWQTSSLFNKTANNTNPNEDKSNSITENSEEDLKLIVSESCKKRLREICKDDKGTFLRVIVEGGGCSGFMYKFNLDKELKEDDLVFGDEDAKVVVDKISLEFCNGATVDYHIELIRSGFRIASNPLAEQGCSCGTSFAIRMD